MAHSPLAQCFGVKGFGVSSQNRTGWVGFRYPSIAHARDKPEESTGEAPRDTTQIFCRSWDMTTQTFELQAVTDEELQAANGGFLPVLFKAKTLQSGTSLWRG